MKYKYMKMALSNVKPIIIIRIITLLQIWIYLCCGFSQFRVVESKIGKSSASIGVLDDVNPFAWDHIMDLNDDYRLLWTINNDDAIFEVQVRTHGYVGFGFSRTGNREGADIAIGWVDKGQTFFQDRYVSIMKNSTEPLVDPSQDYILLMGYENTTHTVIRFRRKLDTCDSVHDIAITNDTMRIMFLHDENDPPNELIGSGSLPNLKRAWQHYRSVVLVERSQSSKATNLKSTRKLEFRNSAVELPYDDGSLVWCKFFELDKIERKNHIVKFEPILDSSWSLHYLQFVTLYQCTRSSPALRALAHEPGQQCHNIRNHKLLCNAYMASWSRGSPAFIYPPEVGYPLDTNTAQFVMMETHYNNLNINFEQFKLNHMFDSSGLRIYVTENLRENDAGLMSIGIDPSWHHIIPPGQKRVVSQGHCTEQCTQLAFPSEGINIFATMMRTHQIGVEVKLRQIRNSRELAPIVSDNNIDPNYEKFRLLPQIARSLPGDRLVAECVYDSSIRRAITLGGSSMKEESCTIFVLYYPKQEVVSSCHSSPSLATVLHSLGIEYLNANSDPVVISLPQELKGMTLETRLLTYNWDNQFEMFQDITLNGAFKVHCQDEESSTGTSPNSSMGWPVNITQTFIQPKRCKTIRPGRINYQEHDFSVLNDIQNNYLVEVSVRNSRSSLSETLALSGLESSSMSYKEGYLRNVLLLVLTLLTIVNS